MQFYELCQELFFLQLTDHLFMFLDSTYIS